MKKIILWLFLLLIIPFSSTCLKASGPAGPTESGTYRTHSQIIEMYKQECDKFPSVTSYKVIGKTFMDNDIWAFSIGNPEGGKIILDGCMHGWEDLGSEITFLWIKWLLESKEPAAKRILKENCWIIIPVINFDSYERGNANYSNCKGGVDLNRNFYSGWVYVTECNGPFGTSHGAGAGSEKETQVLRAFMEENKPSAGKRSVYINTHYGGGPWIHYNSNNADEYYLPLRNRITDLWNSKGIVLQNVTVDAYLPKTGKNTTNGGAAGDAASFGYEAFTVETLARSCVNGHKFGPVDQPCGIRTGAPNHPTFELMENGIYPIFKQFYLAVSESVSIKSVKKIRKNKM